MKVVIGAILAIYGYQIVLTAAGVPPLGAAVLADIAVGIGIYAFARKRKLTAGHFGWRRPSGIHLGAGVLIGLSAWFLTALVVYFLVGNVEDQESVKKLRETIERPALAPTLFALGLLPPLVEETVFRGVLTRSLAARFDALQAIAISAIAFGLFHLIPAQMISTCLLGFALGFLTLRAASIVPAVLAHLLNNVIAVVLGRREITELTVWMEKHNGVVLASCVVMFSAGLVLAAKGAAPA